MAGKIKYGASRLHIFSPFNVFKFPCFSPLRSPETHVKLTSHLSRRSLNALPAGGADALGSLAKGRGWTLGPLKPTKDDATQIFIHWNLWKHGNPVSWTSQAGSFALTCCIRWFCLSMTHSPLWIQPSTANCLWSYRNPHASFWLFFARIVFGSVAICWNVDGISRNDGSCVNEDVPESKRLHLGGFRARMTAEDLHRLQSENGENGEGHRDTQKSLLGRIWMVFLPQLCQGRLPQQVDRRNCQRDSSYL